MNTSAVRHDSYQDFVARQSDHEGQFVEGFGKSSGRRNVDSEIVEAFSPGMGSEQPPNPRSFHLAPKHPHLVTENQKLHVPFHARVMASQGETDVSSVDPMCLVLPSSSKDVRRVRLPAGA
jgi:hypothetical protein